MKKSLVMSALALLVTAAFAVPAHATHAWGSYHWARTANGFTIKLGDNMTSQWDSYLSTASVDWTKSTILDTTIVAGGVTNTKNCTATSGRVEVCNASYGNNGWLGLATISVSGSHITAGTVKMNDTYFETATYNTPAWRLMVTCQEVGHDFGLGHQDENFDNPNLGTCMDYTRDPSTNQHPNTHDYNQIETIYKSHFDSSTTISSTGPSAAALALMSSNNPTNWGTLVKTDSLGRTSLFVKDLGNGEKVYTHVMWAL